WARFAAFEQGAPAPTVAVLALPETDGNDAVAAAHEAVECVRAAVHDWLADPRLAGSRLAVVTRPGELAHAPVTGLVRAAQAEHPGRFALVAATEDAWDLLPAALDADEPEIEI